MKLIGNIIWFVFVGLVTSLIWFIFGLAWCVTIVGIPVGLQCFKLGKLALFPFGKEIEYSDSSFSFVINVIWIILPGLELCLYYLLLGVLFCMTIIGIPFGLQLFKLAKLALLPFGAKIVKANN